MLLDKPLCADDAGTWCQRVYDLTRNDWLSRSADWLVAKPAAILLILLVALVMAGVVAAMKGFRTDEGKELGDVILAKIKEAVRKVDF